MSLAWLFSVERPFGGQFDEVGFVEVEGNLDRVVLFCFNQDCKFLWRVTVETAEKRSGELVSSLPTTGDILSIDVTDSRANLFIDLEPEKCYRDVDGANSSPVRTCEYAVNQSAVTLSIWRKSELLVSQSGQAYHDKERSCGKTTQDPIGSPDRENIVDSIWNTLTWPAYWSSG